MWNDITNANCSRDKNSAVSMALRSGVATQRIYAAPP
jgi:hypothetical protein